MAKFSNASGSLYLNVYIEPGAPNYANNTTIVNWRMTVSRTGAYYTYNENGDSTLSLDLNGGRVHTSNPRWRTSGEEFQMASGSTTVGHNADGTKSFSFSATFNPNNGLHGVITVSGNISLKTIPRASSVSAVSGTIGSGVTINISRASDSFTHKVRYQWGNTSGDIASNVGTSVTWTIPLAFASQIPNATSGSGTVFVDTYNGGTLIGTKSTSLTATVPASMVPTLSGITLSDSNATAGSLVPGNSFVQIISDIKVAFSGAAGTYGSTINGFRAEIVGKNASTTSNGGTLGAMNWTGAATVRAYVTDSRGRQSAARDVTIDVLPYHPPVLSFDIKRVGASSSTLQIIRRAKIAPLKVNDVQKNVLTLSFRVAEVGSTTYTPDNGSANASLTTQWELVNSAANLAGTYIGSKSYVVIGTLSDKFSTVEFKAEIATESVVMSYSRNGVGIGKIWERGSLDVAGSIYSNNKLIQHYQLTSDDGYIIDEYYTDFDSHTKTGVYHKGVLNNTATPNAPSAVWGILQVYSANNGSQILQIYTERDSPRRTFRRLRSNSIWYEWKQYAEADHPMLQEKPLKSVTMGFPFGLNATLTRKDNLVTVTLNRRITNIDVFEYREMIETIPNGYRPTAEVHMVIVPNSGSYTKVPSVLHLASNGVIRLTNGTAGQNVYTGTISYVTNDPYPS